MGWRRNPLYLKIAREIQNNPRIGLEDLLRREPVEIEADEVARMVRGKRVLVTGAGGSIGAELCRQALQLYTEPSRSDGAAELILLGHGENSIFKITRELRRGENGRWKEERGGRDCGFVCRSGAASGYADCCGAAGGR